jgi:hypothetical protein
MVAALIQRGEVNLTRWLPYLPCRGNQAQSKQRRVSRWLHNSRINVHRLYKPLIQLAAAIERFFFVKQGAAAVAKPLQD